MTSCCGWLNRGLTGTGLGSHVPNITWSPHCPSLLGRSCSGCSLVEPQCLGITSREGPWSSWPLDSELPSPWACRGQSSRLWGVHRAGSSSSAATQLPQCTCGSVRMSHVEQLVCPGEGRGRPRAAEHVTVSKCALPDRHRPGRRSGLAQGDGLHPGLSYLLVHHLPFVCLYHLSHTHLSSVICPSTCLSSVRHPPVYHLSVVLPD